MQWKLCHGNKLTYQVSLLDEACEIQNGALKLLFSDPR